MRRAKEQQNAKTHSSVVVLIDKNSKSIKELLESLKSCFFAIEWNAEGRCQSARRQINSARFVQEVDASIDDCLGPNPIPKTFSFDSHFLVHSSGQAWITGIWSRVGERPEIWFFARWRATKRVSSSYLPRLSIGSAFAAPAQTTICIRLNWLITREELAERQTMHSYSTKRPKVFWLGALIDNAGWRTKHVDI